MLGVSGMTYPPEFGVGELVVPTFLADLIVYIDASGNSQTPNFCFISR